MNALIGFPSAVWKIFNWMLTSSGDLSEEFKRLAMPLGTIIWKASASTPMGFLACDGSLQAVNDYPELAADLGTLYGGDGVTTFGLPNLEQRFVVGAGGGGLAPGYLLGTTGGEETHVLTVAEMPAHTHTYNDMVHTGGLTGPANAFPNTQVPATPTGSTGGDQGHENRPPYIAFPAFIKY